MTVLGLTSGFPKPGAATARYVASVLDRLGYRASVRLLAYPNDYLPLAADSRNRVQLSFYTWFQDFPAPWDFIGPLLTCASFVPANAGNANAAEFCDPQIDTQVHQALAQQAQGLAAAAPRWAAIDHELTDQAPWVPLYTPRDLTVLTARGQLPVPPLLEPAHRPALGPIALIPSTLAKTPQTTAQHATPTGPSRRCPHAAEYPCCRPNRQAAVNTMLLHEVAAQADTATECR